MNRAPRVLVSGVVLGQPMGGVRRHNSELLPRAARLLAERGGSLAVLEGREPVAFELPASVERIPSDVPPGPPIARARREGRALGPAPRAAAERGAPFDLVHTAHLPAPRNLSAPYTLTLHDLRALTLRHTPFSRRFVASRVIGAAVRAARLVLTVSEAVRTELIERFALEPERVTVVPNAADHLEVLPRDAAADAPLLSIGHLEPRKNLALLLRALAADADLPPLEFAGAAKHDEETHLRDLANELGVAERVRFLGPVDEAELPRLYARAACVVLPSRLEGFGIPALEAQRVGVPLAISAAGALPEVAGDDTPRFDPDDPAGCAAAIHAALRRAPAELAKDAERAARFRWDASAELLLAVWEKAAAG